MKSERSFACGQRVRTNCYMAIVQGYCKTKYKMSPSSVRSEGGEAAAGYCLNSVSYRVDEAVKYDVLSSD